MQIFTKPFKRNYITKLILIFIVFIALIYSFISFPFLSKSNLHQREYVQKLVASLDQTSITVKEKTREFSEKTSKIFATDDCKTHTIKPIHLKGIYQSSEIKNKLISDCFLSNSFILSIDWANFYSRNSLISWIYTYDSLSKIMRIYPPKDLNLDYGPNLNIENFSFFKNSKKNFPSFSWTKIKEDASGTGKIIIATKAIKRRIPNEYYISISIDLNLERFISQGLLDFHEYHHISDASDSFVYYFTIEDSIPRKIGTQNINSSQWYQIKPRGLQLLNIESSENKKLIDMAIQASSSSKIESGEFLFNSKLWHCSVGKTKEIEVFILSCSV